MSQPHASRPHMPEYGISTDPAGMLPWAWAVERLQTPRNYWLSTIRSDGHPDGRPHVMPIWCVWVNEAFYFSTSASSRKARNLAVNAHCVISVEHADGALVVEGIAAMTSPDAVPAEAFTTYKTKYDWELDPKLGPIYVLQPRVVFGFSNVTGEFNSSATRWTFS